MQPTILCVTECISSQCRNSIMIKEEYLKHVHFHQKYTHTHLENGIVEDPSDPSKNKTCLPLLFDIFKRFIYSKFYIDMINTLNYISVAEFSYLDIT